MRWFWYSLIGFCLLMCGCRTHKMDSNVKVRDCIHSETSYLNESVKISTQKHAYSANEVQAIVIEEDITVTEYDKETGKPAKETKTKRTTTQDSDKVVDEQETQAVTSSNQLDVEQFREVTKKVDSEVAEESIGGQEAFGKWFGIAIGCVIGLLIVYLLDKFRVN